ncbi:MAG: glycyl-radical enzyme activating protein [Planctomycetota bacterium]
MRYFQKGWNFSQDGPGHRLVYHLQGCNLHCPWCANPEGMDPAGTLLVNPELLEDAFCPRGAIRARTLDRTACAGCASRDCTTTRRNQAIAFSARDVSADDIVREAAASKSLFHDGGGVTFTGGEPTLQFDELRDTLRALREAGIPAAIETNGTHPRLPDLFPWIGTLMIDFKHPDSQRHRNVLGMGNETVIANLREAARRHPDVLARIPCVPGFNDAPEDMNALADILAALRVNGNPRVELLRYHEYGKIKWSRCGLNWRMPPAGPPADPPRGIFEQQGLTVVRT